MTRPRILIVEDNTTVAGYVAILLGGLHGLNVARADSLAAARAVFRSFRPDRLVVDLNLPDGDGTEFLREAKAVRPQIRSVVTTGRGDDDAREAAARAGADAYLVKPVECGAIVEALDIPPIHELWDDERPGPEATP